MEKTLQNKLDNAIGEMERRKHYFRLMVENEIDSDCFEKNAIAELTAMLECKTRITALEEALMLARIYTGEE